MKKIVTSIACITIAIGSFHCNCFAKETNIQKGINFLLKNGFSYEEIVAQFPEDDLEVISHAVSMKSVETSYDLDEEGSFIIEPDYRPNIPNFAPDSSQTSTSGQKLTQTVSAFDLSNNKALLTYTFKWNETPSFRKTDCCAMLFDGAKLSQVRNAYYQYSSRSLSSGDTDTETKHQPTSTSSNGIGISFKLESDSTHAGGIKDHQNYNHRGYISCYATVTSKKCINVWSEYHHQQGVLTLTPTISISGVSVKLSANTQMVPMLPNPYLSCPIN